MAPEDVPEPVALALAFTATLERLGIRYLIGGSFASSVHGEPRSTNDIDVLAEIRAVHIDALVAALGSGYYASATAARDAIEARGSFNVIHIGSAMKVDVFVAGDDPFNAERLDCRERVTIGPDPGSAVYVDTAEHSVLRKLEWYHRGGCVSDRQWRDVVSVLRAQGSRLDQQRLDSWSGYLGVRDLLNQATSEARVR